MRPAFAFPTRRNWRSCGTCLRNGKHALVEKPLLGIAGRNSRLDSNSRKPDSAACYTAYNHRFEPHIARLKANSRLRDSSAGFISRDSSTATAPRATFATPPWRDNGLGVFSDLGSHMLDMAHFLFGPHRDAGELWSADRFENKAPDHVLFGYRGNPVLEMEATLLSWRNTFRLDLFGELGSAHIDCLCKWGPSTLTIRKRVLPSGRPKETVEVLEQPDPTWQLEYDHFLALCGTAGTNLENDVWIHEKIQELGGLIEQVPP